MIKIKGKGKSTSRVVDQKSGGGGQLSGTASHRPHATPRPASAPPPLGPYPQKETEGGRGRAEHDGTLETPHVQRPTSNPSDFGFILIRIPQHSVPGSPYTSIYMAGASDLAVSRGSGRGWTVAGVGKGSGVRAVALLDPSARCRVPVRLQVGLRPRTNPVFVLFWLN